ncbi:MAG: hypothetical protein SF066_15475 [Thermoanaerobaculia bacterium]|nr:hypothetical protein [Thermoanaerobaculia bacterium]
MTKILAEDHRVRTLLVDHGLPSWVTAHRVGAAELAGAIYDTECWEDAANAFLRAYQNAEPTEVARSVLLDLLLMAGPGIYFRDFEDPADGSKLISLPFETDTHAEIAAAAYDGRRLRLQAVPDLGEYPGGLGRIPLRAPKRDNQDGGEAFRGWNLSEGGTARAWVPLLAQWANIAKSDRDRYAEDAVGLAERITTHFRNEVLLNPTEEPHKYLALPARVIAANREFFDDLCSLLQGLPIYVLEGSDSFNRERNEFGPVLVMLHDQWKRGPR